MDIKHESVDVILTSLMPKAGQSKPISILASNGKKYMLKRQIITMVDCKIK